MLTFDELKEKVGSWAAMKDLTDRITLRDDVQGVMLRGQYEYNDFSRFEIFCDQIGVVYHGAADGLWALMPGQRPPGHPPLVTPAARMRPPAPRVVAQYQFAQPLPPVAPRAEWRAPDAPAITQATEAATPEVTAPADPVPYDQHPTVVPYRRILHEVTIDPPVRPATDGLLLYSGTHTLVMPGQRVQELADGPGTVVTVERDFVCVEHDNGQTVYYLPHDFVGTAELIQPLF
jgi:hypothetical protein